MCLNSNIVCLFRNRKEVKKKKPTQTQTQPKLFSSPSQLGPELFPAPPSPGPAARLPAQRPLAHLSAVRLSRSVPLPHRARMSAPPSAVTRAPSFSSGPAVSRFRSLTQRIGRTFFPARPTSQWHQATHHHPGRPTCQPPASPSARAGPHSHAPRRVRPGSRARASNRAHSPRPSLTAAAPH